MTPTDSAPPEPAIQVAARRLAEGHPAQAAEQLGALVAGAPTYAAAHVLRATALEAAGFVDEAIVSWGRAAALVPRSPLVHRERERLLATRLAEEPPPDLPAAEPAHPPSPPAGERGATPEAPGAPELTSPDLAPESEASAEVLSPEGRPSSPAGGWGEGEALADDPFEGDPFEGDQDEAGWGVLDEADVPTPPPGVYAEPDVIAPEDAAPPPAPTIADELDALITQLEDAPRIRPDPDYRGPEVSLDDGDVDDVASETLAQIYVAQRQYVQAALVYETLAARQPDQADALLERAAELRQRRP